jgi:hypothetical protein
LQVYSVGIAASSANAGDEMLKEPWLVIGETSALATGEEGDCDPPAGLDDGPAGEPAPGEVAIAAGDEAGGLQPTVRAMNTRVRWRSPAAMPEGWTRPPRAATVAHGDGATVRERTGSTGRDQRRSPDTGVGTCSSTA